MASNFKLKASYVALAVAMALLTKNVLSTCAYRVDETGQPVKLKEGENEPKLIEGLTMCTEWNGQMGCCDINNDVQQVGSYIEIDGVFGEMGGGCDHCAINMKRFWCEYACSARQGEFMKIKDGFEPVPNPQKPDEQIMVQKVKLTVEANTACALYNSCKRIGFVTSVSAMGSPAGFLNFQGHNAVNDAFQYIEVNFSYNESEALTFNDDMKEERINNFTACNQKVTEETLHGFKFNKNCTCNTCEEACDDTAGFIYTEPEVLEDFNWVLVARTYVFVGVVTALITLKRSRSKEKQL